MFIYTGFTDQALFLSRSSLNDTRLDSIMIVTYKCKDSGIHSCLVPGTSTRNYRNYEYVNLVLIGGWLSGR